MTGFLVKWLLAKMARDYVGNIQSLKLSKRFVIARCIQGA